MLQTLTAETTKKTRTKAEQRYSKVNFELNSNNEPPPHEMEWPFREGHRRTFTIETPRMRYDKFVRAQ